MKLIAIGDIHCSGFTDDALIEGYPARLFYIKESLDSIIKYGREKGITDYVMVGDVYNDKTIIYNASQDMLVNFFLQNSDLNFILISGNHDLSATGTNQKSAISAFQKYPNVHCVLHEPEVIEKYNGVFVPYAHDFLAKYRTVDTKGMKILFAHVGLNEGVLQSGLSRVDKLKMSDINNMSLLILGHYHKPQKIEGTNSIGYYVGSLIPKDWNDKNEDKRFLVVDTDTLEVESVNIDCPNVPKYVEIVITEPEQVEAAFKTYDEQKKLGNKVRIVNKSKEKLVAKAKSVSDDIVLIEHQDVDVTNRGITVTQTKLEQCKKYLEIKEIENVDKYLARLNDWKLLEKRESE